jgi:hypothetical protein
MNCCDEYGNCNQGRNCPVRKKKWEDTKFNDADEDRIIIDRFDWELAIFVVIAAAAVSFFL